MLSFLKFIYLFQVPPNFSHSLPLTNILTFSEKKKFSKRVSREQEKYETPPCDMYRPCHLYSLLLFWCIRNGSSFNPRLLQVYLPDGIWCHQKRNGMHSEGRSKKCSHNYSFTLPRLLCPSKYITHLNWDIRKLPASCYPHSFNLIGTQEFC